MCFKLRLLTITVILFLGSFVLITCGPSDPDEAPTPNTGVVRLPADSNSGQTAYPVAANTAADAYPIDEAIEVEVEPYPVADIVNISVEPEFVFKFTSPLLANDSAVSGQAPPNLSIGLIDVTFNGVMLGSGMTGVDGRFKFDTSPLPAGHRVGITITAVDGNMTFEEMIEMYYPYRGDNFLNIPNIGVMFESTLVSE